MELGIVPPASPPKSMPTPRILATALSLASALAFTAVTGGALAQESQLDALKAAARASSGDANAALALGRGLRRAGHQAESLAELRRGVNLPAARTGDIATALHLELARTQIAKKDFGQAMVQCRVLGAVAGGAGMGHACAAEAHLLWNRASEALAETSQALAGQAKIYDAKVSEGLAHELELKDTEAEASFREALQWKSDRPEAHVALGRLLMRTGQRDAALQELRQAIQLDPNGPDVAFELAQALPANPEAVTLLQRAVRECPTFAPAIRNLAVVQLSLGDVSAAKSAAETALSVEPQDASTHVVYGKVLLADGKPDDAIRAAQSALKILPNAAGAKLLIADAYAKKGEIDLAVENYQNAYGLDHSDPSPLVHASEASPPVGTRAPRRSA